MNDQRKSWMIHFLLALSLFACEPDHSRISEKDLQEYATIIADNFPVVATQSELINLYIIHTQDSNSIKMESSWLEGDDVRNSVPPPPNIPFLSDRDLMKYQELGYLTDVDVEFFLSRLLELPDSSIWQFPVESPLSHLPMQRLQSQLGMKRDKFISFRRCSIPLFSRDGKRVLFFVEQVGNSGSGWFHIYHNAEGQWREVYSAMTWIS